MGKQRRRRKKHRGETPESVAFRGHLLAEVLGSLDLDALDWPALHAVSRLMDVVDVDGEPVPLVIPLRRYADHMDFDRAMCRAGIRRFVRRVMPSDQPRCSTPIDPETGEPDPSIPVPDVRFGEFLIVEELSEGLRVRREVWFTSLSPTGPAPGRRAEQTR